MRSFIAATMLLATIVVAEAKQILIATGIGGHIVAPMTDMGSALTKRGHNVTFVRWNSSWPKKRYDIAIGHSAGDRVLRGESGAKRIYTIDPTWLNVGCPRGATCTNWYNRGNAFPLVLCCGGYRVNGATNIVGPYGHTGMPARLGPTIVASIGYAKPKLPKK